MDPLRYLRCSDTEERGCLVDTRRAPRLIDICTPQRALRVHAASTDSWFFEGVPSCRDGHTQHAATATFFAQLGYMIVKNEAVSA